MDSRDGREPPSAGELDEETIARKRSRRVSFAETTAVHVFDRDEDYETPPESTMGSGDASRGDDAIPGFQVDHSDSDDSKVSAREDEEEEEEEEEEVRFIRDMDSSSPGSAVGSVTSNDDDNFFGPVSTSFIRRGSLSEGRMSDDNDHDITLDSTAFSLHFRNIVPPDDLSAYSAGSIMTPSEDSAPTKTGDLVTLMRTKRELVSSKSFDGNTAETKSGSNNMSLVGDKSSIYDYAKLSPTLEKLLDEVDKSMLPNSLSSNGIIVPVNSHSNGLENVKETGGHRTHISNLAASDDCIHDNSHLSNSSLKEMMITKSDKTCHSPIMQDRRVPEELYHEKVPGGIQPDKLATPIQQSHAHSPPYEPSRGNTCLGSDLVFQIPFEDQLNVKRLKSTMSLQSAKAHPEVIESIENHGLLEPDRGMYTPEGPPCPLKSLPEGSISSLRAKRQQLFLDAAEISAIKQPPSSLELELMKHDERISAIKKHISKSRIIGTPEYNNSRLGRPRKDHLPFSSEVALEKAYDVSNTKSRGTPEINLVKNIVNDIEEDSSRGRSPEAGHSEFAGENSIGELEEGTELVVKRMKLSNPWCSMSYSSLETIKLNSPVKSENLFKEASNPSGSHQTENFAETNEACQAMDTMTGADNQGLHTPKGSLPVSDNSVGKRRRVEDSPITLEDHVHKTSRVDRSPDFSNDGTTSLSLDYHVQSNDKSDVAEESSVKAWTDILSKATNLLVSPSTFKFSLLELDELENKLDELQMARKYMLLSSSLRNNNHLTNFHRQRVAEVRLMQDKLLFEKAKVHIKRAKVELLRNKVQLSQSGVEECHKLKSMFSQLCFQSKPSQLKENSNQEDRDRVLSMQGELKTLEKKLNTLLKSLEARCKTRGNSNCYDVMEVANEYLRTKNCLRSIHHDLKLWVLKDIVKRGEDRDIVLSYSNLLIQRFTIKLERAATVIVSHSLNEANVVQTFPNMNALTAFQFVFKVKTESRVISFKCLQQKTLESTLLLGTLVDVLEEVQTAATEILNLTSSEFSQSTGQLELGLCFWNFRNGRKVTLSLNMSNLNCAVYPSDPTELKYTLCKSQTTLPLTVFDDIIASVKSIQGERFLILRFCQSVSKLVQASAS